VRELVEVKRDACDLKSGPGIVLVQNPLGDASAICVRFPMRLGVVLRLMILLRRFRIGRVGTVLAVRAVGARAGSPFRRSAPFRFFRLGFEEPRRDLDQRIDVIAIDRRIPARYF